MSILYLSNYRENSGYSIAAEENILSVINSGVDIVTRSVKMLGGQERQVSKELYETEKKDLNNITHIIQHNLPSEFGYKSGVKNIGAFAYETDSVPVVWLDHLKMMDHIVVFCDHQYDVIRNAGIKNKVSVIPHAFDITKFNKHYEKNNFGANNSTFKFYTISEFNRRKNLTGLIAAYSMEFTSNDDVLLVIKANSGNKNLRNSLKNLINEVRGGCGRFNSDSNRHAKICLITDYVSDDDICSIHQNCNAFVSASYAEAFAIPFASAMGFGNPSIVPNHTAFSDYQFRQDYDLLVDCHKTPVLGVSDAPKGLYSSDENWWNVSIPHLRKKMRQCRENYLFYYKLKKDRKDYVEQKFSREKVGQLFKDLLT